MSEERYTLREAAQEIARIECAGYGHRTETVIDHTLEPRKLICTRCGKSWRVEPSAKPTQPIRPSTEKAWNL